MPDDGAPAIGHNRFSPQRYPASAGKHEGSEEVTRRSPARGTARVVNPVELGRGSGGFDAMYRVHGRYPLSRDSPVHQNR
jgi:hypothetical protein